MKVGLSRLFLANLAKVGFMSCPQGRYGQSLCNIVNHPDRLGETFCGTCERRFLKREFGLEVGGVFAAIAAILLIFLNTRGASLPGKATNNDGANDLPASNVAQSVPAPLVPLPPEAMAEGLTEDTVSIRILDLPIKEQIDYLNGVDRIASS